MPADENTRLAQSAYEAFGRGDMAALAEVMADDIEWVNPGDPAVDPATARETGRAFVITRHTCGRSGNAKIARLQIYLDTAATAAAHRVT